MKRDGHSILGGRAWAKAFFTSDEIRTLHERFVVSIVTASQKKKTSQFLGNGFIVKSAVRRDGHRGLVIVTAAHVLVGALQTLRPDLVSQLSNPFSPPLIRHFGTMLAGRELHAICHLPDNSGLPTAMAIYDMRIHEKDDVAVVFVECRHGEVDRIACLPINSDRLALGSNVAFVGYPQGQTAYVAQASDHAIKINASFKLSLFLGKITKVHEAFRHCGVFGYETDVPMPPGISGAPVFTFTDDQKAFFPLEAVGICMSDSGLNEDFDRYLPGSSFAAGAESLRALSTDYKFNVMARLGDGRTVVESTPIVEDNGNKQEELLTVVDDVDINVVRNGLLAKQIQEAIEGRDRSRA